MVWFNGTWPVALWANNLCVNGSSEVAQSSAKHGTSEGPSFHEAIRCGTGIYCKNMKMSECRYRLSCPVAGVSGEGVASHRQEKASSDPAVATTLCRLLLFDLSFYKLHPLAQNLHHHVAHSLEPPFHCAGYALYRVELAAVINPRPTCIFAVSITDEAYLCQYRQRSRFTYSWLFKRARLLLDWSCTCCALM